jgi:hypothetical protein
VDILDLFTLTRNGAAADETGSDLHDPFKAQAHPG